MNTTITLPFEKDLLEIEEIVNHNEYHGPPSTSYKNCDQLVSAVLNLNAILHHCEYNGVIDIEDLAPIAQQKYKKELERYEYEIKDYQPGTGPPPFPPSVPTIEKEIKGTEVIIFPGIPKKFTIPFEEFKRIYIDFIKRKQLSM